MKIIKAIYLTLFLSTNLIQAGSILLSKTEVEKSICKILTPHFLEHTFLADDISDHPLKSSDINIAVEIAIHEYCSDFPEIKSADIRLRKPGLLKEILKDYPNAINDLVHEGILTRKLFRM